MALAVHSSFKMHLTSDLLHYDMFFFCVNRNYLCLVYRLITNLTRFLLIRSYFLQNLSLNLNWFECLPFLYLSIHVTESTGHPSSSSPDLKLDSDSIDSVLNLIRF